MGNWLEREPKEGETVRFSLDDKLKIGIYIKRGYGSAQNFWIIDVGNRRIWAWDLTTFEVWER
jgi:hypothetical protein